MKRILITLLLATSVAQSAGLQVGVTGFYQHTQHLALRGGYRVMWLTGDAFAPDQISDTDFGAARAGVDTSGTLFCQGGQRGPGIGVLAD